VAKAIFSASWYRVRALKPRLRSHAQIHRHQYRGDTWHVLQELSMERFFRFTPAAYGIIGLMNGERTVEQIWQAACEGTGDAPTQDEMIEILSQLYRADVLQCDVTPDAAELLSRHQEQKRKRWQMQMLSVFSWRFPLIDPERFLRFMLPVVRPFFGWIGALIWLAVVIPAAVLLASHWTDLSEGVLDRVLVPQNLLALWAIFPLIKVCHEFGHAFATKTYGGEVHDMGIMMLVIAPVPYVDASSASAFREKWRRVVVGAAGMIVELFIAAIALFVWINAEPGIVRGIAYNAILIASISTVLFNGNPLLRYDGYYILADLIEIPNLRTRSTAYLLYLCERYLFGSKEAKLPPSTPSERVWFVSFGILSFVYRTFVVVAILMFVAQQLFRLGAILAIAAAVVWLVFPPLKGLYFLMTSPRIRSVRPRAFTVTAVIVGAVVFLIGFVPVPYRTGAEGVVWMPDEAIVRAGTEGFVDKILVESGTHVAPGTVLVTMTNPPLKTRETIALGAIQELEARRVQYLFTDPVKANVARDELEHARERLSRVRSELADLVIRSKVAGTFIIPIPEDLPARFFRKGELLGYIVEPDRMTVRTVISPTQIDLVRNRTEGAAIRLADQVVEIVPAAIKGFVPGASPQLPARQLGTIGGGTIAMDPSDRQGLTAMQSVFQVDLEIPPQPEPVRVGGRAYVRFDHGWTPLAVQWYFQIRQIFLSRFDV
jgi:putative peptide zinc metalloprotease protein